MTSADRNALFRLHRRAHIMRGEAQTWLLATAVASGDAEARQRALAVVTALEVLASYAHDVLYAKEAGNG